MTTAIPTQPLTAAAFLFGDTKEDSVDALAHALHEQGVLGTLGEGVTKLSRAGRNAANDQIATVAHGLLDLDLGGLVIAGWGKYADLSAAAKREAQLQLPLLVRLGGGIPLLHDIEAPPTSVSVKLEE